MKHGMKSIARKRQRFAPAAITADLSNLSPGDRQAVEKLVEAAQVMNELCLRQTWDGAPAVKADLEQDKSPLGRARLRLFCINGGPWSELDADEPFLHGIPERPDEANFYPAGMTASEFESWVDGLPEAGKQEAKGFFHTIRRDGEGRLVAVPYSQEYRDLLDEAARLLREAAALTDNSSLRKYLVLRADAFSSNDYYDSDVAWMELDSAIEVSIGPYEVYMDRLLNLKAAFQAYVTVRDHEHTAKLSRYAGYLQDIENNLPIADSYKNQKLGALSPIVVVNELAAGGYANHGVRTAAFNLPNDERVVKEKGTKQVLLKNIQQGKFEHVLVPIAACVLDEALLEHLSFDAFFDHILFHELLHGLGPHSITVDGRETSVRLEMKNLHSALEEAKADITALFALQFLIDRGDYPREMEKSLYATFLASMFRSVRFGITKAHGRANALSFSYLMEQGAILYLENSARFTYDLGAFKAGVRKLAGEIMTLQAEGSYQKAEALLNRYAVIPIEMDAELKRLSDVPIDIEIKETSIRRRKSGAKK